MSPLALQLEEVELHSSDSHRGARSDRVDHIDQSERHRSNGYPSSRRKVSASSGTGGDAGLRPRCRRHLRSVEWRYSEALGDDHLGGGRPQRAEGHSSSRPSIRRLGREARAGNGKFVGRDGLRAPCVVVFRDAHPGLRSGGAFIRSPPRHTWVTLAGSARIVTSALGSHERAMTSAS